MNDKSAGSMMTFDDGVQRKEMMYNGPTLYVYAKMNTFMWMNDVCRKVKNEKVVHAAVRLLLS